MKTRRGDVVLVLFPDANLRTAKRRPALVIQATSLNTGLSQTLVAMITSNLARAGHASRVAVPLGSPESRAAGMRTDSVIMADNIATVADSEIASVIGRWTAMSPVDAALKHTLALV
ncbi:MAG TPA: type II toxin-antitoxin system PemK/MazF family toxin [Chthoniobacteraceae bacterium]|jgi:mRNA interferase MazF|nr:type II toxin-antitoxin system PemK/MazF family toxin [Chthoniobacteraceae bacterium]